MCAQNAKSRKGGMIAVFLTTFCVEVCLAARQEAISANVDGACLDVIVAVDRLADKIIQHPAIGSALVKGYLVVDAESLSQGRECVFTGGSSFLLKRWNGWSEEDLSLYLLTRKHLPNIEAPKQYDVKRSRSAKHDRGRWMKNFVDLWNSIFRSRTEVICKSKLGNLMLRKKLSRYVAMLFTTRWRGYAATEENFERQWNVWTKMSDVEKESYEYHSYSPKYSSVKDRLILDGLDHVSQLTCDSILARHQKDLSASCVYVRVLE